MKNILSNTWSNFKNIFKSKNSTEWSGAQRLKSDIFWCSCFGIFEAISQPNSSDIGSFLGASLGFFFLAFFWSWKPKYVQDKSIRRVIQVLFAIFIAMTALLVPFVSYTLINNSQSHSMSLIWIALFITWDFFVIKKYVKLMKQQVPLTDCSEKSGISL